MPYIGKDVPRAYQSTTAVQRFNGDGIQYLMVQL
mgnify:CR=1 FL=1